MQLQTILNRVEKHRSFVYERVRWTDEQRGAIEVTIRARAGGRPRCSGCGKRRPAYDRLTPRRFEFVPLWGILVYFVYAMRRVNCTRCGVIVECVPWADGKSPMTHSYVWFLARWAKRMSWQEVAEIFHTSWDSVYRAVRIAVEWGLKHREIASVESIGVDEILWQRGHRYLTVVYQIDAHCRRLLWVGLERKKETLEAFFDSLGKPAAARLRFVCSDMWRPYLDVVKERAAQAVHVLDRYHIVAKLNEALDDVRAEEAKRMKAEGSEPLLKHSRWVLLKCAAKTKSAAPANRTSAVAALRGNSRSYTPSHRTRLGGRCSSTGTLNTRPAAGRSSSKDQNQRIARTSIHTSPIATQTRAMRCAR